MLKRWKIGGEGFWDYFAVEPGTGRVFIPRGKKLIILDSDGNKVAEIPGFEGAHAITFAPSLKLAYVSDGDRATFFSTDTNKILRSVSLAENGPDAILFDLAIERVFAFGRKGATVLDGKTGDKLTTIPLGGKPEFSDVSRTSLPGTPIVGDNRTAESYLRLRLSDVPGRERFHLERAERNSNWASSTGKWQ